MSQTVLHIDGSVGQDTSLSRAASAALVAAQSPSRVIRRDVAADPLPHITTLWAEARLQAPEDRSAAGLQAMALTQTLIAELQAADTIIIGMPIYNFGMPASLKAWADLVAVPKVTFQYTPNGPEGLLKGKKAIIAVASGGVVPGSPADFASTHLAFFLRFLGIEDVTVIPANDVNTSQAA